MNSPVFIALEQVLLAPFRLPSDPLAGYWLGCAVLALASTIVGETTARVLRRVNRSYLADASEEALSKQAESIAALRQGDRAAYDAANKLANEAFGQWFFHSAAVGTSSLWPAFFAAAWLNQRFGHVVFPLPWGEITASFVAPLLLWLVVLRLGLAVARHLTQRSRSSQNLQYQTAPNPCVGSHAHSRNRRQGSQPAT
jgi:hypothetical protein